MNYKEEILYLLYFCSGYVESQLDSKDDSTLESVEEKIKEAINLVNKN